MGGDQLQVVDQSGAPLRASPIIAIYTKTRNWIDGSNSPPMVDVHRFNVIGLDFSSGYTYDSQWLGDVSLRVPIGRWARNKYINELIAARYVRLWYLAFVAAKEHGLKRISNVEVGDWREGSSGLDGSDLFEHGLNNVVFYMLGYGTPAFDAEFPGIKLVSDTTDTTDTTDILYINPWGTNASRGSHSHGATLVTPLCWPMSNPYISFRSLNSDAGLMRRAPSPYRHLEMEKVRDVAETDGAAT